MRRTIFESPANTDKRISHFIVFWICRLTEPDRLWASLGSVRLIGPELAVQQRSEHTCSEMPPFGESGRADVFENVAGYLVAGLVEVIAF